MLLARRRRDGVEWHRADAQAFTAISSYDEVSRFVFAPGYGLQADDAGHDTQRRGIDITWTARISGATRTSSIKIALADFGSSSCTRHPWRVVTGRLWE
ncbi:hypothetical protein VFPBJ_04608 [Purpureocillium lilacinum]|uniref:Uncharacterized protein n=1 Tax=Purpureocillium lilacinum TaxID=33203 RepID=A0A179GVV2_PURLI|nr:hypothetical protein VFPBJ_04608 [Purpureocillium lilacinum]